VKILLVRFSSIGDIVLTTPVIRAIHVQLPDAEIHYLTKRPFVDLLTHNPHIHKIIAIDRSIQEVIGSLKSERYTVVIDLHHNLRTLRLRRSLGVPTHAFPKLNFKKWLLVRFKWNRMPEVHVVDRYYDAVKAIGVKPDHLEGEIFLANHDEVDIHATLGFAPKTYTTIAIGAQFQTKQLPLHKLHEIIEGIRGPVVLIGGASDSAKGKELVRLSKRNDVISTCGQYSLVRSASIVKQSKVLLTNDTGMMHIAACFGVRIVSIWGNTVPALGMYPYIPSQPQQWSKHEVQLNCRPCSKIGFSSCPKGHFNCMEKQDVQAITEDVNRTITTL